MASETTYKCDRCGASVGSSIDFHIVRLDYYPNTHAGREESAEVGPQVWLEVCGACFESLGFAELQRRFETKNELAFKAGCLPFTEEKDAAVADAEATIQEQLTAILTELIRPIVAELVEAEVGGEF